MYQVYYKKFLARSNYFNIVALGVFAVLILIILGKYHYIDLMNNQLELKDISLDIPSGMEDYKTGLKRGSFASHHFFTSYNLLVLLANVSLIIFLILAGYRFLNAIRKRQKDESIIAVLWVIMAAVAYIFSLSIPTENNDAHKPKTEVIEYANIFRIVGLYTDKGTPENDVKYLKNQLYAIGDPTHFDADDIGRPVSEIPDRIAYLFDKTIKYNIVKKLFNTTDSQLIQNKAYQYEKEFKRIAEYNAVTFWKLQWVVMTILGVMAAISTKMILVRLRLRKKIEILRERK